MFENKLWGFVWRGVQVTKHVSAKKAQSYQEVMAGNLIIFLCIYAMIHWLTSDEFTRQYENLIVVFAIMRIIIEVGVILPEKVGH